MFASPEFLENGRPSVCRRISIGWDDEEPDEDCDVLVLSTRPFRTAYDDKSNPQTLYLDLRISKATGALDWAFAGIKVSAGSDEFEWLHFIDSRIDRLPFITPEVDKGPSWTDLHRFGEDKGKVKIHIDPTGNAIEYEYGKGWNPKTNKDNSQYCELWKYHSPSQSMSFNADSYPRLRDEEFSDLGSLPYLFLTQGHLPNPTALIGVVGPYVLALTQSSPKRPLSALALQADPSKSATCTDKWTTVFLSQSEEGVALKEQVEKALELMTGPSSVPMSQEIKLSPDGPLWNLFDHGIALL